MSRSGESPALQEIEERSQPQTPVRDINGQPDTTSRTDTDSQTGTAAQAVSSWWESTAVLLSLHYFLVVLGVGVSMTFGTTSYLRKDCQNALLTSKTSNNTSINCSQESILEENLNLYLTLLLIGGIVGIMVWTVGTCYGPQANCHPSPPEHLYLLYGAVLFGIVAIFWFLLKLLGNTEPYQSSQYVSEELYAAIEIVFILMQIFFLCLHGGAPISNHHSDIKRLFIMHVIATNCCLWFRTTVGEANERGSTLKSVCQHTIFQTVCLNTSNSSNLIANIMEFSTSDIDASNPGFRSDVRNIAKVAMPFIYPFIAEFCLCASGLLLNIWLNAGSQANHIGSHQTATDESIGLSQSGRPTSTETSQASQSRPVSRSSSTSGRRSVDQETTPLLRAEGTEGINASVESQRGRAELNHLTRAAQCTCRCLSAATFAIILISFCGLCLILKIVFEQTDKDREITAPAILYQSAQIAVTVIALISASLGLWASYETNTSRLKHSHRPAVEFILLMIALAGLYLAQCLHLYASLQTDYVTEQLHLNKEVPSCMAMWILSAAEGFLTSALGCIQSLFLVQSITLSSSTEMIDQNTHRGPEGGINDTENDNSNEERNQNSSCMPRPSKSDVRLFAAVIVVICNLTLWISKTYELSGFYCNPVYSHFYSMWVQLSDIFYPLWIFFHFHSAALCFDVAKVALARSNGGM